MAASPVGWFVGVVQERIESLIGLEAEELGFGDLAAAEVPPAAADFFEEESLDAGRGFQGTAEIGFHLEEVVLLGFENDDAASGCRLKWGQHGAVLSAGGFCGGAMDASNCKLHRPFSGEDEPCTGRFWKCCVLSGMAR